MLEFIILGQVPGTNVVITYSWVLAVGTVMVGASILKRTHNQHDHHSHNIEDITL